MTRAASLGPSDDAAAAVAGWTVLLDSLPDAAWIVDARSLRVVADNGRARALLGSASLIGERADTVLVTPEDLAHWDAAATGHADALESESTLCAADGRSLHVMRSIRPLREAAAAAVRHHLVVVSDRSAVRVAEDERERALAELQATLESTGDGILVTDLLGRIRAFNRRFVELWGIPQQMLQAHQDDAVFGWMRRSVPDADAYERRLRAIQDATLLDVSERLTLHGGAVLERITRPLWCRGQAMGRVYCFRDLSGQLAAQSRIEELSLTDVLTGLPNRRQLGEHVARASARLRSDGRGFALLLVDLDRFRHINDSLGHDTGDQVLIDVAQRMRGCLRSGDVLARIGGDQFALLVDGADALQAEAGARRVLDAVAAAVQPGRCAVHADLQHRRARCARRNGHSADELLRHAEAAMRAVKDGGRAGYRVHRPAPSGDRRADIELDHAMRQALASGRFRLHYQPQVDLGSGASGRRRGADPLARPGAG